MHFCRSATPRFWGQISRLESCSHYAFSMMSTLRLARPRPADQQVLADPPWLRPIPILTSINIVFTIILASRHLLVDMSKSRYPRSIFRPVVQDFISVLHRFWSIRHRLLAWSSPLLSTISCSTLAHPHKPRDMLHSQLMHRLVSHTLNQSSDYLLNNHSSLITWAHINRVFTGLSVEQYFRLYWVIYTSVKEHMSRLLPCTLRRSIKSQSSVCSLKIISQISKPASSVFLSQKTNQQYFQPARLAQTNRLLIHTPTVLHPKIEIRYH
jgi:hypothetical protein